MSQCNVVAGSEDRCIRCTERDLVCIFGRAPEPGPRHSSKRKKAAAANVTSTTAAAFATMTVAAQPHTVDNAATDTVATDADTTVVAAANATEERDEAARDTPPAVARRRAQSEIDYIALDPELRKIAELSRAYDRQESLRRKTAPTPVTSSSRGVTPIVEKYSKSDKLVPQPLTETLPTASTVEEVPSIAAEEALAFDAPRSSKQKLKLKRKKSHMPVERAAVNAEEVSPPFYPANKIRRLEAPVVPGMPAADPFARRAQVDLLPSSQLSFDHDTRHAVDVPEPERPGSPVIFKTGPGWGRRAQHQGDQVDSQEEVYSHFKEELDMLTKQRGDYGEIVPETDEEGPNLVQHDVDLELDVDAVAHYPSSTSSERGLSAPASGHSDDRSSPDQSEEGDPTYLRLQQAFDSISATLGIGSALHASPCYLPETELEETRLFLRGDAFL